MARAQAAFEFLSSYGWMLLVLALVLGVLVGLGSFTGPTSAPLCTFRGSLNCETYMINNTGQIRISLGQMTGQTIRVTAMRCTQETDPVLNASDLLASPVAINSGDHAIVTTGVMRCYILDNGTLVAANRSRGQFYRGRLYIEYEEMQTGYVRSAVGDVYLKFEDVVIPTPAPNVPLFACQACQFCENGFGTCTACQQGHLRNGSCGSPTSCGSCPFPKVCNGGGGCVSPVADNQPCNCSAMCASGTCGSNSKCTPRPVIRSNITGYVKSNDSQPIMSISVVLSGPTACSRTTNNVGFYSCTSLSPGGYTVSAQRIDWTNGSRTVSLLENTTLSVNLTLYPNPGSVVGFVKDLNGIPIADPTVVLVRSGAACTTTGFTQVGRYECMNLMPGVYAIRALKAGYQYSQSAATVLGGVETELNFTLRP